MSGLKVHQVATHRIRVGAQLEEQAISECERLVEPGATVLSSTSVKAMVSQLYFDAYAVAVWTSAHAEYLASLQAGIEEPPAPSMFTVPCAFTSIDLTELYARRSHLKSCPRATGPLLQLISRCTNPGARGWDPVLDASLKTPGIRRIIAREFEVCLTGLHPQLHPALRPNWQRRLVTIRVVAERFAGDTMNAQILKVSVQTKEIIRRMLASTMANSMGEHVALSCLGHPVRHLHQPPMQVPHIGMEAAMAAFVAAGSMMVSSTDMSLSDAITSRFSRATRRTDGLQWIMGWLGKGTCDVSSRTTLVELSSEIWAVAFKTNFVSLWMHGMSKKLRISRLDPVQHTAVHGMNAITHLCAALPTDDQLEIQRIVLQDPAAATRTLSEVVSILCLRGPSTLPHSFKCATDALETIALFGATGAAKLFTYARVAWVSEQIVTVNFGDTVARRQVATLMRRMRRKMPVDETDPVAYAYRYLPTHATSLCVCTGCQRVANAHVSNGVGDKPFGVFNEIGVSQSMIRWGQVGDQTSSCLHCAKRSSAALRTAMAFQDFMRKRKIEGDDVDESALRGLMVERAATSVESGIAARIRRDAKNALEQRAVAASCGDSTMLTIPLLGRALRVYDSWYALCSYCTAVTRVTPVHRYGGSVCCLRCDHQMLYREQDGDGLVQQATQHTSERACRYCGVIDPERSGTRWKQVKAPHDVAGANATLPPPLRKVWYCPSHYRPWVPGAHRVLPTRVILAHLATNAKPVCFGESEQGEEGEQASTPANQPKPKRKRRKI